MLEKETEREIAILKLLNEKDPDDKRHVSESEELMELVFMGVLRTRRYAIIPCPHNLLIS